jgi:UDP-GlcNAc3NAcA epimerase
MTRQTSARPRFKVATVVGARPQFIKCAPVSKRLRQVGNEVLVHTGQHYDENMSARFFEELEIPQPDYNLNVGAGTHGTQTAQMLERIAEILTREKPDWVLVYGDTNSTLAGALAAVKLHIPVAHVEAGLRSFYRRMPEEINRVLTDHISALHFCPTETAVRNLTAEGIRDRVFLVGDVMYDVMQDNLARAERSSTILQRLMLKPNEYILATIHRAENTDDPVALKNICDAIDQITGLRKRVVFPAHPRTFNRLEAIGALSRLEASLLPPVSYLDMLKLVQSASLVMTDSGGVQKEAYWLSVPCVTLRNDTEWIETVESGWNILAGNEQNDIVHAVRQFLEEPSPVAVTAPHQRASNQLVDVLCEESDRGSRYFSPRRARQVAAR